ncbi:hypothetical protein K449DRAFT_468194 [Hypoxylon sp. EC38]|nr:hypothetical protein K449DRAFT_468194 [Hypoxylon sp. EC38]
MEGVFINSLNLGILVEKEILVHVEDKANGDSLTSRRPSVVSIAQSVSDMMRETRTPEPLEKTPSSPSAKMLPRSDVTKDRAEDLVDFFRSPPPPGNFMSIPDDFSISSADGKWGVFKVFRKRRKGKRRKPPLIKLPDSAVSARTIDGHRYIAISIPSNYAHSDEVPSQDRSSGIVKETSHQTADSTRSQTSSHGKKIPKPFGEDHGSLSSVSLAAKKGTHPEETTRLAPPPKKVTLLSTGSSHEGTHSGKGKEPDRPGKTDSGVTVKAPRSPFGSIKTPYTAEHEAISPKRGQGRQTEPQQTISEPKGPDTKKVARIVEIPPTKRKSSVRVSKEPTTSDGSIPPKSALKTASKSSETTRTLSADPLITLTVPTRSSSKRTGTREADSSEIDDAITTRPPLTGRTASSNQGDNGNSAATGPRRSFAESLVTTESSPEVLKAQTATAYPIVIQPPPKPEVESPLDLNFPAPPTNRVSRSVQADLSPPSSVAEGARSRKDRVRERKQKDIQRLKDQLSQSQSPGSHLLKPGVPAENNWPESPVLGRFNQELGSPSSRPLLVGKMSDMGPIRPSIHLKPSDLLPEAVHKKCLERSNSAPVTTSSSSRSRLESPSMPLEGSTAYYRLKQRQAEWEENEARKARYEADALAQEKESQERRSHQKLLRRYERLKDTRAKEMEERLHRLERNSDVLMQSLVSLMDTLNTLMRDRQALQRSVAAYQIATPASQPRERHRGPAPRRSQSLRSVRSGDDPLETLNLRPEQSGRRLQRNRKPSLRLPQREGGGQQGEPGTSLHPRQSTLEELQQESEVRGIQGGSEEMYTQVRQSTLDALQEHLRSQPHPHPHPHQSSTRAPGISGYTSSSSSDRSNSLEIMEPLMRELQEAARLTEPEGQAEGAKPLTESEIFKLF